MAFIMANGVLHHYLQDGLGEDVVLVHGLACNLAFWYPGVMVALRRKYRVLAYDLRGHGKSKMSQDGYTHVHMAEDLASLTDALEIEKFHLVGHSYGGLISISFALRHPHRLRSLTLADVPIDKDWSDESSHGADKYPELAMLEQLARNPSLQTNDANIFAPFHQGRGSRKTAKRWLNLLETTTARQDFSTRKICLPDLENLQIPTLLTYGLNSKWKNSAQNLKSHLPCNIVVYVQEAGHSHPWEKPGVFLHSWLEFITSSTLSPLSEKRQDLRYSLPIELRIEGNHDSTTRLPAETVNVSAHGMLVKCSTMFRTAETIWLFLKNDTCDLKLTGRVIRCEPENDMYLLAIDVINDYDQLKLFNVYVQSALTKAPPFLPNSSPTEEL